MNWFTVYHPDNLCTEWNTHCALLIAILQRYVLSCSNKHAQSDTLNRVQSVTHTHLFREVVSSSSGPLSPSSPMSTPEEQSNTAPGGWHPGPLV